MAKLNECIFRCMDVFFFIFYKNVLLKTLSTSYLAYQSLFIWFTKIFHLGEKDSHNRQTYFQKKIQLSEQKKNSRSKKKILKGKKFSQQKKNSKGKKNSQCKRKVITTKKTLTVKEKFSRKKKVSHDDKKVVRINLSKQDINWIKIMKR